MSCWESHPIKITCALVFTILAASIVGLLFLLSSPIDHPSNGQQRRITANVAVNNTAASTANQAISRSSHRSITKPIPRRKKRAPTLQESCFSNDNIESAYMGHLRGMEAAILTMQDKEDPLAANEFIKQYQLFKLGGKDEYMKPPLAARLKLETLNSKIRSGIHQAERDANKLLSRAQELPIITTKSDIDTWNAFNEDDVQIRKSLLVPLIGELCKSSSDCKQIGLTLMELSATVFDRCHGAIRFNGTRPVSDREAHERLEVISQLKQTLHIEEPYRSIIIRDAERYLEEETKEYEEKAEKILKDFESTRAEGFTTPSFFCRELKWFPQWEVIQQFLIKRPKLISDVNQEISYNTAMYSAFEIVGRYNSCIHSNLTDYEPSNIDNLWEQHKGSAPKEVIENVELHKIMYEQVKIQQKFSKLQPELNVGNALETKLAACEHYLELVQDEFAPWKEVHAAVIEKLKATFNRNLFDWYDQTTNSVVTFLKQLVKEVTSRRSLYAQFFCFSGVQPNRFAQCYKYFDRIEDWSNDDHLAPACREQFKKLKRSRRYKIYMKETAKQQATKPATSPTTLI